MIPGPLKGNPQMALKDPLSLREVRQLASSADTILLSATRTADLETPIGAFMRFDNGQPAFLLESVEGGERLGRYSFMGVCPRRVLTVRDGMATVVTRPVGVDDFSPDLPSEQSPAPDPLAAIRRFVPKRRILPKEGMPRFPGGAVGALAYDAVSIFEPTVPLPDRDPIGTPVAAFQECDLVLVFDHLTHTLSAVASLHTESPDIEGRYRIAEKAILEALERTARPTRTEAGERGRTEQSSTAPILEPVEASMTRDHYEAVVADAKEAIAAGECFQVVMARRQTFERPRVGEVAPGGRPAPLDEVALYRALRRINPSPYLFFVRMPEFAVVGASPELLIRVEGDKMDLHPIAGTRGRGATPAEDAVLAYNLERDPKERSEHVMLVDLGRNDLGRVARAGTVSVARYMEIEKYSHVLHLVSNIEARLKPGLDALDALRSVFPAGTLSGAPKVRAMQLIAQAENERRGIYGGAVGYLGYDGNLDTAIAIRSCVIKDDLIHVTAGAGIVAGSVPAREYEEIEQKAASMRRAIELAVQEAGGVRAEAGARADGLGPVEALLAGTATPAREEAHS